MDVIDRLPHRVLHRPVLTDLAVALTVLLATLLTTTAPDHLRDGPALAAAATASAALLLRQRLPWLALVISTVAAEAYLARYQNLNGILILGAPLVALYTVAELSKRRWALLAGGLVVLAVGTVHTVGVPSRLLGPENLALTALGGLAVAAGTAARHRRAYLSEVERRAADAARDSDTETRRRLTEQRLRIARDLHDSVGHHLALIAVQAGVAEHTTSDLDPRMHHTLAGIRDSSKAALEELKESVGLLRHSDDEPMLTQPIAGLGALPELVASCRRSGLVISLQIDSDDQPLPWATDHTAYRIVQESLTNVRKHAGAVAVTVTVRCDPDAVTILVDNDGVVAAAGDGHGITGMRERAAALGGTLLAGPRPGGGFRVAAVLPVRAPS